MAVAMSGNRALLPALAIGKWAGWGVSSLEMPPRADLRTGAEAAGARIRSPGRHAGSWNAQLAMSTIASPPARVR